MDLKTVIRQRLNTINNYSSLSGVKIRGDLHYHNFVDFKWTFYIKSCVLTSKNCNKRVDNLKLVLLTKGYTVPEGYETIMGGNGECPFILSPELYDNSLYRIPESQGFGVYYSSETRRRKYRVKAEKIVIVDTCEVVHLSDVMIDLHY